MEDRSVSRHNYIGRVFIVAIFFSAMFLDADKVGQSETMKIAAEQSALSNPERAPIGIGDVPNEGLALSGEVVDVETVNSSHISMPKPLKGVYLTGWSAGHTRTITRVLNIVDTTDINAVIIDIKDATGRLSYQPLDPVLASSGVGTNRIRDLSALISTLHERNIYVIGRVAVFQDPFYVNLHPEEAFLDTRTGQPWQDYKGISWLRADSRPVWDYHVAIAIDAFSQGFDEINVDYVRFPSDGQLAYLDYSIQTQDKAETISSFFQYIDPLLRGQGIILSADLFGLTMSAKDDLGIGQKLELIAPYVDIVAPMVYPSHFASGAYGIPNPAQEPYKVIYTSISQGIEKLVSAGIDPHKLRPWLQDFDLGAIYTEQMVRDQIRAVEDLGLDSWMLWDPRNIYTQSALALKP